SGAGARARDGWARGIGLRHLQRLIDRRRGDALPRRGGHHSGLRHLGPAAAPVSSRDGDAVRLARTLRRRLLVRARVRRALRTAAARGHGAGAPGHRRHRATVAADGPQRKLTPCRVMLTIHPAGRGDAPGVVDLIGRVYQEYGFVYVPEVEVP